MLSGFLPSEKSKSQNFRGLNENGGNKLARTISCLRKFISQFFEPKKWVCLIPHSQWRWQELHWRWNLCSTLDLWGNQYLLKIWLGEATAPLTYHCTLHIYIPYHCVKVSYQSPLAFISCWDCGVSFPDMVCV